jgi:hypothetical protein
MSSDGGQEHRSRNCGASAERLVFTTLGHSEVQAGLPLKTFTQAQRTRFLSRRITILVKMNFPRIRLNHVVMKGAAPIKPWQLLCDSSVLY